MWRLFPSADVLLHGEKKCFATIMLFMYLRSHLRSRPVGDTVAGKIPISCPLIYSPIAYNYRRCTFAQSLRTRCHAKKTREQYQRASRLLQYSRDRPGGRSSESNNCTDTGEGNYTHQTRSDQHTGRCFCAVSPVSHHVLSTW